MSARRSWVTGTVVLCGLGSRAALGTDCPAVWSPDGLARDGWRAVARRPASRGRLKAPAEGFLRVVTINILFICGGAFSGSERIIGACGKGDGFGHGAKVCSPDERRMGAITA